MTLNEEILNKKLHFLCSGLGLSHLCEHKFKHSFEDCLNPLCPCGNEIKTSTHYLPHLQKRKIDPSEQN